MTANLLSTRAGVTCTMTFIIYIQKWNTSLVVRAMRPRRHNKCGTISNLPFLITPYSKAIISGLSKSLIPLTQTDAISGPKISGAADVRVGAEDNLKKLHQDNKTCLFIVCLTFIDAAYLLFGFNICGVLQNKKKNENIWGPPPDCVPAQITAGVIAIKRLHFQNIIKTAYGADWEIKWWFKTLLLLVIYIQTL